ncbi:MAG: DUF262 domain-containing HNH endonuclease family protein [Candidatus Oceanisphaera merdipullorum]|nr:DUF262 domain-containing HNH endonuclease family protein [Candidatus Oceanisphaera merdipullorum]
MSVNSKVYSLKDIANEPEFIWLFNIPIYQRLYVWGADQINTLLSDIASAFDRHESQFFLGNTIVVENTSLASATHAHKAFDLIDGQQRFTTLWLLSTVAPWNNELESFSRVTIDGQAKPRLHFSIRDSVNNYLQALIDNPETVTKQEVEIERLSYAQALMTSFKNKHKRPNNKSVDDTYIKELAKFIYENVKLVLTQVSPSMDLNKLFEIINNRGAQLQHHEILKAKLLAELEADERWRYSAIWDACSDMDNFVDRSLRSVVSNLKANELGELYKNGTLANFEKINELLGKVESDLDSSARLSLKYILEDSSLNQMETNKYNVVKDNNEYLWSSSIISFSLFLQHVLRIWLLKNTSGKDVDRLLDKQLLALFNQSFFNLGKRDEDQGDNARSFINLLWQVRVLWDDFIIKRIDMDDDKIHRICSRTISASYISTTREESHKGLSLLQSMLYHSQEVTTHYWLTPFLNFLVDEKNHVSINNNDSKEIAFKYLRNLDNYLFGQDTNQKLLERSRLFMESSACTVENFTFDSAVNCSLGVATPHYWFYKLDFVLWYLSTKNLLGSLLAKPFLTKQEAMDFNYTHWHNFRFTAKNSVEHVSPQNPQGIDQSPVSKDMLDDFGNLALVSRNLNSEYGNLPFNEKQSRYHNKKLAVQRPESLKMDLIYQHKNWGDEQVAQHQAAMLKALEQYYAEPFVHSVI